MQKYDWTVICTPSRTNYIIFTHQPVVFTKLLSKSKLQAHSGIMCAKAHGAEPRVNTWCDCSFYLFRKYNFFLFFTATPLACGSSQARGQIRANSCWPSPQPEPLGVQVCDLQHHSRQCWILHSLSGARGRSHILTDTLSGSSPAEPQWGLPQI